MTSVCYNQRGESAGWFSHMNFPLSCWICRLAADGHAGRRGGSGDSLKALLEKVEDCWHTFARMAWALVTDLSIFHIGPRNLNMLRKAASCDGLRFRDLQIVQKLLNSNVCFLGNDGTMS
jgi:hypothetical protein